MSHRPHPITSDILRMPLDHAPADQVVAGRPTQATHTLGSIREVEVGVWELTEGTVRDTEVDEIFVVLRGRGRIEFEGGGSVDLSPGTCVRLDEGDRTIWTITETLRKIWIA